MLTTKLYPETVVYGPYYNSTHNRWFVALYSHGKSQGTMLLSRFKMQEHLGRLLSDEEQVDHQDDDKTNDAIENLQILTEAENIDKAFRKYHSDITELCFWCNKSFVLTPKQQRLRHMNQRRTVGAFCSLSCVSQFGRTQKQRA